MLIVMIWLQLNADDLHVFQPNNELITNHKKRSEETQTLRAGCTKAEPKKIRPAADPLHGGRGTDKI